MKQLNIEEAKKLELDLLLYVAKFCDENNLEYRLNYGTLIGAIRHKGFIPWDDDVDISMTISDALKFAELFNKKKENEFYVAQLPNDKGASSSFVKVVDKRTLKIESAAYKNTELYVDLDIFTVDGAPSDKKEFDDWYAKLLKLYIKWTERGKVFVGPKKLGVKEFLRRVYKGYYGPRKGLLKKAQKLHDKYPYDQCEMVGSFDCCWNGKGNWVKKEVYDDYVLVDFEGHKFKAPIGYDTLLTNIYGDYMTPPPEDKRASAHGTKAYLRDGYEDILEKR